MQRDVVDFFQHFKEQNTKVLLRKTCDASKVNANTTSDG